MALTWEARFSGIPRGTIRDTEGLTTAAAGGTAPAEAQKDHTLLSVFRARPCATAQPRRGGAMMHYAFVAAAAPPAG